jgi:hypothetical protein
VADAVVDVAVPERVPDGAARRYPRSVRGVFSQGPPPADVAARPAHLRDTIARLADRVFRGRGDDDTTDRLVTVASLAMEQTGGSFEQGVAAALTAMLSSPRFLFRIEADGRDETAGPGVPAVPLDDIALASRLSYFLWSSMPDDELMAVAREGRLHAEFDRQIARVVEKDAEMRSYVTDLEDRLDHGDDYDDDDEDDEDYEDDDEEREESAMTLDEITSENLPSADELEAELQEFLRKQRDDG